MKDNRFHIISDDSVWMFPADVSLSTIEMPRGMHLGYGYETCIFHRGGSDVLERYHTLDQAIAGHKKYEKQYELKEKINGKYIFN